MISTFYGIDQLVTAPSAKTFLAAMIVGLLFGFALERAGFGSSRKLAGIFYFRDMTVLKVMFTALITAMLGLSLVVALGWIDLESQVYVLPTLYGAQILGGLIFGVGFVLSSWCPGTAAVGVASGKLDAVVFLVGVIIGAIVYNETYGLTAGLLDEGAVLVAFGLPRGLFALLFTLAAVGAFYFAEWVERKVDSGGGKYLNTMFLRAFSIVLVIAGVAVFIMPSEPAAESVASAGVFSEQALLEAVEGAEDHIEPEELADALLEGEPDLLVVDVRTPGEYKAFHIPGAVNVPLPELIDYLAPYQNRGRIILYSNGMTHPAQARDSLARLGYQNVFMLTDGLQGFLDRCLTPVSLRREPLPEPEADQVRAWRASFLGTGKPVAPAPLVTADPPSSELPGLVDTAWLAENFNRPGVRVIDCRSHADYTSGHIPGSLFFTIESFRGIVGGLPSMLLPGEMIAKHLSLWGVEPTDTIVLVPGDSVRDATLIGMGLDRVGHARWGILNGGFAKWAAENRPLETTTPAIEPTAYPAPQAPDNFTVDYKTVLQHMQDGKSVILDVRPTEFFTGEKSTEARPGHIPGAINRPYSEDLSEDGSLKPATELQQAYNALIPTKDTPVVVHCRTGHQASQTFFVLKHLLGYTNVMWYDASWSDWASRPELPVVQ